MNRPNLGELHIPAGVEALGGRLPQGCEYRILIIPTRSITMPMKETIMRTLLMTATVAVVAACSVSSANAANPGEAAYSFLKIGTDARSEAMGGAMTAVADQLGASFYNPAALARTAPRSVMASYVNWLTDIQAGALAAVWGVGQNSRIGLSAQYLDYGDFDPRDAQGNPGDDFSASDVALAVSWAAPAGRGVNYGITGRFVSESIDDVSSSALSADIGATYDFADQRSRAGVAVRNLGAQTQSIEGGDKEDIPITLAAGFSHRLRGAPVSFAADVLKPSDDDLGAAFGVEVAAFRQMLIRAGYNTLTAKLETDSDSDNLAGLSLGAGFIFERLTIDYAFATYSELGDAHRFSIGSRF